MLQHECCVMDITLNDGDDVSVAALYSYDGHNVE